MFFALACVPLCGCLLAGCVDNPATVYSPLDQPFTGRTSGVAAVETDNLALPIYSGFPAKDYKVIGIIGTRNRFDAARVAKSKGADALIFLDSNTSYRGNLTVGNAFASAYGNAGSAFGSAFGTSVSAPIYATTARYAVIKFKTPAEIAIQENLPVKIDFTPYEGRQQDWPVKPGSSGQIINGILCYFDSPEKPYDVLGTTVSSGPAGKQLAALAISKGADALVVQATKNLENDNMQITSLVIRFRTNAPLDLQPVTNTPDFDTLKPVTNSPSSTP